MARRLTLIYKQQDYTKLGEKEMNSKVFELNKLLSDLDGQGGYFIDFISIRELLPFI
jgi:hypothetical protein